MAEFYYSSATRSIMALRTNIHILQFEFIDFHSNLYVEQCFRAYKPCSKSKSLFCPRGHQFLASTQGSGRQTSFYIEICMEIDELNSNRYVGTKKLGLYNTMALGIASELANSTISYDF